MEFEIPFVFLLEEDARFSPWNANDPACFPNFPPNASSAEVQELVTRVRGLSMNRACGGEGKSQIDFDAEAYVTKLVDSQKQLITSLVPLLGAADESAAWQRIKHVFDLIATVSQKYSNSSKDDLVEILPYRRRNFESQAMIAHLLRSCGLVTCPPSRVTNIIPFDLNMSSSKCTDKSVSNVSSLIVPVVYLKGTAAADAMFERVRTELQSSCSSSVPSSPYVSSTFSSSSSSSSSSSYSSSSTTATATTTTTRTIKRAQPILRPFTDDSTTCKRFVVLLTAGVLRDEQCVTYITTALSQKREAILLAPTDPIVCLGDESGFRTYADEAKEAAEVHPEIARMFNEVELLPYRRFPYEWTAVVEELRRRLCCSDNAEGYE